MQLCHNNYLGIRSYTNNQSANQCQIVVEYFGHLNGRMTIASLKHSGVQLLDLGLFLCLRNLLKSNFLFILMSISIMFDKLYR